MKSLKEALVHKHMDRDYRSNIKHDPDPVNLEDVSQFINGYPDLVKFEIDAHRWQYKGIDELTDWLTTNIFEMPKKKENFTLWVLNEYNIEQDLRTEVYLGGRYGQNHISDIHDDLLSSKSNTNKKWKDKIQELVTKYDNITSLSSIKGIDITYCFSNKTANQKRQIFYIKIELI